MSSPLQLLIEWLDREKQDFPVHAPGKCVDPVTCLTCRTAAYIEEATSDVPRATIAQPVRQA
jgi:hypothetical protein